MRKIKVLIAGEFSGRIRDAFLEQGDEALSCDIAYPSDTPGPHYLGDVRDIWGDGWDLMIAHPPCTYLCNSGVRWLINNPERHRKMVEAASFFKELLDYPNIPFRAIENPIMHKYAVEIIGRRQDIIVQPWQHGHGETKATGFWLVGLPPLKPSKIVSGRVGRIHKLPPSKDRWKLRSETYPGIAKAIAHQWGNYVRSSL